MDRLIGAINKNRLICESLRMRIVPIPFFTLVYSRRESFIMDRFAAMVILLGVLVVRFNSDKRSHYCDMPVLNKVSHFTLWVSFSEHGAHYFSIVRHCTCDLLLYCFTSIHHISLHGV